jgi:hypothetical protein
MVHLLPLRLLLPLIKSNRAPAQKLRKAFLMPKFLFLILSTFMILVSLETFAASNMVDGVNMDDPNLGSELTVSTEQRSSLNAASCDFNCPECMKANPMCGNRSLTDSRSEDILSEGPARDSKSKSSNKAQ